MEALRIRSITAGLPINNVALAHWTLLEDFYTEAEDAFRKEGIGVQTRRIVLERATPSNAIPGERLFAFLDSLSTRIADCGVRWVCLPIAPGAWGQNDVRQRGVEMLRRYPFLFLHCIVAENSTLYPEDMRLAAKLIMDVSRMSRNGFDNFRLGVGANIAANTPFFPFSWHDGQPAFSLAVESLGFIFEVLDELNVATVPLSVIRETLISRLAHACRHINSIAQKLVLRFPSIPFRGMDISIAPFPDETRSVALLLEKIGLQKFGGVGSVSATAFFTCALKSALLRADVPSVGFNGVMFSPLEDKVLAARMRASPVQIEHLMLLSTVCGCGIDMVPVAGDSLIDSITSLIHDVSTLSTMHKKPLGVRILPIPGKRVNELTEFNHDFFANTRILHIDGESMFTGNVIPFA